MALFRELRQLLRLRESNPAEFENYVQMAADAAKLAQEQPEVFASLLKGDAGIDGTLGGEAGATCDTCSKMCVGVTLVFLARF